MTRTYRARSGAILLTIATSLLLAACGGTTATSAPSVAGGAPTAPPVAATPGAATQAPPDGAIPSFDIGQLTAGLANVDSYRVSVSVDDKILYSGTVVTKPVLSRRIETEDGTFIVIGSDTWISDDGVTFEKDESGFASQMLQAFDPTLYVALFSGPQWAQSALAVGHEEKNGVSSTHYRIDGSTLAGGFTGLPSGASIDMWIADSGILASLETTGFAGEGNITIQVTNVDDPANKVEAPN